MHHAMAEERHDRCSIYRHRDQAEASLWLTDAERNVKYPVLMHIVVFPMFTTVHILACLETFIWSRSVKSVL